ncbi:hypothetical protein THRCLA_06745, partial [Thraustotheca clavata]
VGVLLAAFLMVSVWYCSLSPDWMGQYGDDGSSHYSQGVGLWSNYTQQYGANSFDPGNSFWMPTQGNAVNSFADQCAGYRKVDCSLLEDGEYSKQYCNVMSIYCGTPVLIIQLLMSLAAGLSIVVFTWVIGMAVWPHRTFTENYLLHVSILTGFFQLIAVGLWYMFVYVKILSTTFYTDEFARCKANPTYRSCWGIRYAAYATLVCGGLFPALAIALSQLMGLKSARYRTQLKEHCKDLLDKMPYSPRGSEMIRPSDASTVKCGGAYRHRNFVVTKMQALARRVAKMSPRLVRHGGSLNKNKHIEVWNGIRENCDREFEFNPSNMGKFMFGTFIPFTLLYFLIKDEQIKRDALEGKPNDPNRYL